jgi:hypothetical protein
MHTKSESAQDIVIRQLCVKIKQLNDDEFDKLAIPKGIDLNYYALKTSGWLPIHFAAAKGKEKILRLLIQKGANPYLSLDAIDKNTQTKKTWKTGFTLITDKEMRERVREYYISQNEYYNQSNSLVALPHIALTRIAENFLKDVPSFSNFSLTSKCFSLLLGNFLGDLKTIYSKKKKVEGNLEQIRFFQSYIPEEDFTISAEEAYHLQNHVYGNGGREQLIQKNVEKNKILEKEISNIYSDLSSKMKL